MKTDKEGVVQRRVDLMVRQLRPAPVQSPAALPHCIPSLLQRMHVPSCLLPGCHICGKGPQTSLREGAPVSGARQIVYPVLGPRTGQLFSKAKPNKVT
jgi:hypothetical protein